MLPSYALPRFVYPQLSSLKHTTWFFRLFIAPHWLHHGRVTNMKYYKSHLILNTEIYKSLAMPFIFKVETIGATLIMIGFPNLCMYLQIISSVFCTDRYNWYNWNDIHFWICSLYRETHCLEFFHLPMNHNFTNPFY